MPVIVLIFVQGQVTVATPKLRTAANHHTCQRFGFHWSAQHAQMRKSPRDVGQAIKDALPAEAAELFEQARDFGGYCH